MSRVVVIAIEDLTGLEVLYSVSNVKQYAPVDYIE